MFYFMISPDSLIFSTRCAMRSAQMISDYHFSDCLDSLPSFFVISFFFIFGGARARGRRSRCSGARSVRAGARCAEGAKEQDDFFLRDVECLIFFFFSSFFFFYLCATLLVSNRCLMRQSHRRLIFFDHFDRLPINDTIDACLCTFSTPHLHLLIFFARSAGSVAHGGALDIYIHDVSSFFSVFHIFAQDCERRVQRILMAYICADAGDAARSR